MSNPEPSWIRQGGTVALEETNAEVTFHKIDRLTATQIVLIGGRRFRRSGSFDELMSDNGYGHRTNRDGQLHDPTSPRLVSLYARQQLRTVAREAGAKVNGSAATVHEMDADDVAAELTRIRGLIDAAVVDITRLWAAANG